MRPEKRIEAIVAAAPGWYASYTHPDGSMNYAPIPVWALVVETGTEGAAALRYVEGIDVFSGDACPAPDMTNFDDYAFLPEGPPPGAEVYPGGIGFAVPAGFTWPPRPIVDLKP